MDEDVGKIWCGKENQETQTSENLDKLIKSQTSCLRSKES